VPPFPSGLRFSPEFATLPAVWLKLIGMARPGICGITRVSDE
jgi:hypothetical protein